MDDMDDAASVKEEQFKLNQLSFDELLKWLNVDRERAGAEYERINKELLKFFRRSGARTVAEELADRTVDRVAKLMWSSRQKRADAPGEDTRDRLPYFKKVARFIFLEYVNSNAVKKTVDLGKEEFLTAQRRAEAQSSTDWEKSNRERIKREYEHDCLEECEERLSPTNRSLLRFYYRAEGTRAKTQDDKEGRAIDFRKELAAQLNITPNTLRVRIHRIREMLDECVAVCVERKLANEIHLG